MNLDNDHLTLHAPDRNGFHQNIKPSSDQLWDITTSWQEIQKGRGTCYTGLQWANTKRGKWYCTNDQVSLKINCKRKEGREIFMLKDIATMLDPDSITHLNLKKIWGPVGMIISVNGTEVIIFSKRTLIFYNYWNIYRWCLEFASK